MEITRRYYGGAKSKLKSSKTMAIYNSTKYKVAIKDISHGHIYCIFTDKESNLNHYHICPIRDNGNTIYIEIGDNRFYINSFRRVSQ